MPFTPTNDVVVFDHPQAELRDLKPYPDLPEDVSHDGKVRNQSTNIKHHLLSYRSSKDSRVGNKYAGNKYAMVCAQSQQGTNLCQKYHGYYCDSAGHLKYTSTISNPGCETYCTCIDLAPKSNCLFMKSGGATCLRDLEHGGEEWVEYPEELSTLFTWLLTPESTMATSYDIGARSSREQPYVKRYYLPDKATIEQGDNSELQIKPGGPAWVPPPVSAATRPLLNPLLSKVSTVIAEVRRRMTTFLTPPNHSTILLSGYDVNPTAKDPKRQSTLEPRRGGGGGSGGGKGGESVRNGGSPGAPSYNHMASAASSIESPFVGA